MAERYYAMFSITGPVRDYQLGELSKALSDWGGNLVESLYYVFGDRVCLIGYFEFDDSQQFERAAIASQALPMRDQFRNCDVSIQPIAPQYEFRVHKNFTCQMTLRHAQNKPRLSSVIDAVIRSNDLRVVRCKAFEHPKTDVDAKHGTYEGHYRLICTEFWHDGYEHQGSGVLDKVRKRAHRVLDELSTHGFTGEIDDS